MQQLLRYEAEHVSFLTLRTFLQRQRQESRSLAMFHKHPLHDLSSTGHREIRGSKDSATSTNTHV